MRKILRFLLFPLLFFLVVAGAQPAAAGAYPKSMAALGDSITQAANVCCWYGDHPAQSWSTGGGQYDGVASHYERLRQLQPAIAGKNHNFSKSGARAADLPGQALAAANQRAEYVTVLIGANDLCTPSVQTMTSEADFAGNVNQALATLDRMRPRPQVFVSSIPNIYQLWKVLHTDPAAQWFWSAAEVCQSMLASTNSEETRQQVVQRQLAFNAILANTCAAYANICRSDGGAVYGLDVSASDVSALDYFHPSLRGQAKLAGTSWAAAGW